MANKTKHFGAESINELFLNCIRLFSFLLGDSFNTALCNKTWKVFYFLCISEYSFTVVIVIMRIINSGERIGTEQKFTVYFVMYVFRKY
jgi:hypothetical protein